MLRSKEAAGRHINPGGSPTSLPLSPERLKPLHAQVTSLREQRITLLEDVKSLKDERDVLKEQMAATAERCKRLEARTAAAEAAQAEAEEDARASKAMSKQLLAAAGAWQSQLVEAESSHTRSALVEKAQRSHSAAQAEQERLRLFNELTGAQAERRMAEDRRRQTVAEAMATRQLLESQRDEALARAARAEDALTIALSEQRVLSERLARTAQQASDMTSRSAESEKKYVQMVHRVDELSAHRVQLEHERAVANEALQLQLRGIQIEDAKLQEERLASATKAAREAALRHQLESVDWAAAHGRGGLMDIERLALQELEGALGSSALGASALGAEGGSPRRTMTTMSPRGAPLDPFSADAAVRAAATEARESARRAMAAAASSDHPPLGMLAPPTRGSAALAARRLAGLGLSPAGSPSSADGGSPFRGTPTPRAAAILRAGVEATQSVLSPGRSSAEEEHDAPPPAAAPPSAPPSAPSPELIESGLPPLPRGGIAKPAAYDPSAPTTPAAHLAPREVS